MPTCPYCAEPQNALKNHVRLSSGDGHGPSGQYPDDFENGDSRADGGVVATDEGASPGHDQNPSPDQAPPENGGQDAADDPQKDAEQSAETVEMTYEEFDEAVQTAAAEASRESQPHGSNQTTGRSCPGCGQPMEQPGTGTRIVTAHKKGIIRRRHLVAELEADDHYCRICDLVVDAETSQIIPGSEYNPPVS